VPQEAYDVVSDDVGGVQLDERDSVRVSGKTGASKDV
jgi:hypothetical protein